MTNKLSAIELTGAENQYLDKVIFEARDSTHDSREAALALTHSLLNRKAIPEIRVKYFTDPKLNVGRTTKSIKQIFESNGATGEDIFRHPDFLKYLHYFIYGPALPPATIDGFFELIKENSPVTSGDIQLFREYGRSETRNHGLAKRKAAEEFYKLSLETELRWYARSVRDAVMGLKG